MPPELDDANDNVEHSLEDVAASLLVKPDDKSQSEQKTKTPVAKEPADENTETDDTDEEVDENVNNEEASAEETADTETENDEEDLDADEFEIDVTVDGQDKKVKLKDLKANYSGNSAIEKRLQEASEIRTKALDLGKHLYTNLQAESERLVRLDEILKKVAEPEIDWEELKRTNLPKYLLERDKQRDAEVKRDAVAKEKARVEEEKAKLDAQAYAEYTQEQAKLLVDKLPEFGNKDKAAESFNKLAKAAEFYGYTAPEVRAVVDHRAMLVLNDAMKYRELMAKQKDANKKTAPATTLLRPGSKAASNKSAAKKLQEALNKKARATGKVEDVAATLLVRKK